MFAVNSMHYQFRLCVFRICASIRFLYRCLRESRAHFYDISVVHWNAEQIKTKRHAQHAFMFADQLHLRPTKSILDSAKTTLFISFLDEPIPTVRFFRFARAVELIVIHISLYRSISCSMLLSHILYERILCAHSQHICLHWTFGANALIANFQSSELIEKSFTFLAALLP